MQKHKHSKMITRWANGALIAGSANEGKTWFVQKNPRWVEYEQYKEITQIDVVPMLKEKTEWLKRNLHVGYVPRQVVVEEIQLLLGRL